MKKNALHLTNVYQRKDSARALYALLGEREKRMNISHRSMPTMKEHLRFMRSKPYRAWYLILNRKEAVGSIYLSKQNEIGLFIFKKYRAQGFGDRALVLLIKKCPSEKRFLANINPKNLKSIDFFKKRGFRHIQNTYELRKRGSG